jgi:UDP-GlcNAc:undecaprenyl-phosphate GlcNAc-1-phosphate transferase
VEDLVLAAIAAAPSLLATPAVRALGRRLGAVDDPGPRRVHVRPTPRLGGLAVLAGVAGALALDHFAGRSAVTLLAAPGRSRTLLLAGFAVVLATGVIDDLRGLPVAGAPGPRRRAGDRWGLCARRHHQSLHRPLA